ncbi:MAG: leucine-rich repeat protein [Eubacterium sp.]|nr:leucine-rich repeat protein [Eubacterium sp.]
MLVKTVSYAQENTFTYDDTKKSDAAVYVRNQLISRNKYFELVYNIADRSFSLDKATYDALLNANSEGDTEKVSKLIQSVVKDGIPEVDDGWVMLSDAAAHTGKGEEGDYLINSLSGEYGIISSPYYSLEAVGDTYSITVEKITYKYNLDYYTTADQEKKFKSEAKTVMDSLKLDGLTDYEKVCKIYTYIADNVTYDKDSESNCKDKIKQSAYAALVNKKAVCQGYASLFYYMANEAGVDCRILKGDSKNLDGKNEHHAWNLIKVGSKYYYMDVTWDSGRENEFKYFLKGSDAPEFSDHVLFGLDKVAVENEYIDPATIYDIAKKTYYEENNIAKKDISKAAVKIENAVYDNGQCKADITVTLDGKVLSRGIDYKVTFIEFVSNTGKGKLKITGIGMYESSIDNIICNMTDAANKANTKDPHKTTENVVYTDYNGDLVKDYVYPLCGFKFKVTKIAPNGTVELVGVVKKQATVVIPDMINIRGDNYKVTSIAPKAFMKNKKLKKLTIGKYVKTIGAKAFYKCKKLKTINIRTKSLKTKTVGSKAFKGTKKKAKVLVPKGKKSKYKKLLRKRGLSKKAKVSY